MSTLAMDKENTEINKPAANKGNLKLTADWLLGAAFIQQPGKPIDMNPLIAMSVSQPEEFTVKGVMHKLIKLLNKKARSEHDKKAKVDILTILGNLASHKDYREAVKDVIMNVSEWFEGYLHEQESSAAIPADIRLIADVEEPTLHKAMLIVLARCFDYRLRSEDLLELCDNDSVLGLATVIGVLEEGFSEITTIRKKRPAKVNQVAQWEQGVEYKPHEKVLVVQCCRLLRGFTMPSTYISSKVGDGVTEESLNTFNAKINQLLALTLDAELVEKVTEALCDCVFPDEYSTLQNMLNDTNGKLSDEAEGDKISTLCDKDHLAIIALQSFLQNLYLYANEVYLPLYRQHLLVESRVTPDMVLPYLHSCLIQACEEGLDEFTRDLIVQGIGSSLKTLIIATFRAPNSSPAMMAFSMLNPTHTLIQSCWQMLLDNVQLLALLIFFNVNLDALNISNTVNPNVPESSTPHALLHSCAAIFCAMKKDDQERVLKLLNGSGNLPVTRDVQSFSLVMGMLSSIFKSDMNAAASDSSSLAEAKNAVAGVAESKSGLAASGGEWAPPGKDAGSEVLRASSKGGDSSSDTKASSKGQASESVSESKVEKAESKKPKSLLGDLPSLIPTKSNHAKTGLKVHKKKSKKTKKPPTVSEPSYSDPNVPVQYKCAINGHIMKEPVRSPAGHVFEKGTIDYWLDQQGSVCPITGEILTLDDLAPQPELKSEIMRWHIKQSMSSNKDDNNFCGAVDEDDDIYDF